MRLLFPRTSTLERKIDEFLDTVDASILHFQSGIQHFLGQNLTDFKERLQAIRNVEHKADEWRREIETQMFLHALIPEVSSDVLSLLENLDGIINHTKATLLAFSIENPDIPTELNDVVMHLTTQVLHAVEAIILATRAFFREIHAVRDHLHRVYFYEHEADQCA